MRALGATVLGVVLALRADPVEARWQLSSGVEAETYAIDERRDAGRDSSDAVLGVAPFVRAARTGPGLLVGAEAEVRYRRSLESGEEEVEPGVGLDLGAVLVEDAVRFDAGASSRLRDTSPIALGGPVGADGPDVGEARPGGGRRFARVDSLELGPSLSRRFGERARLDAAYRYGVDRTDGSEAPRGTERHSMDLGMRLGLGTSGRTSLDVSAEIDRAMADGGIAAGSGAAIARLVHVLGPKLAVSASFGGDRVRVDAGGGAADDLDESGAVYGAGLAWRPRPRVAATASWTERSFGASPAASLRVGGRRSAVTLDWRRVLAFDRGLDTAGPGRGADAALGSDPVAGVAPAADREGRAGDGGRERRDSAALFARDPAALFARDLSTVDERIALGYSLRGRLTDVTVALAHVRREPLVRDGDAPGASLRGTRLGLGVSRTLGRRASLAFDASRSVDDEGEAVHRTRVGLRLSVELR